MKPIIIFGNSHWARLADYYFSKNSLFQIVVFTVHQEYINKKTFHGKEIVPFEHVEEHYPPEDYNIFIALGITGANQLRADIYNDCKEKGYDLVTYIDPNIYQPDEIEIGDNCFIAEGVLLGPYVKIGNNVTINPGCVISHDVSIDDHCFIGTNTTINGGVAIGAYTLLSSGSIIDESITIGHKCIVGIGMVVTKDMNNSEIYTSNTLYSSDIDGAALINMKYTQAKKKLHLKPVEKFIDKYHSFPLTPIQEAYWVGRRNGIDMGGVSTHLYQEIISEDLDLTRLESTWNQLINRHEMLRILISTDGTQKVLKKVPYYKIQTLDLKESSKEVQNKEITSLRSKMSHQVLNSEKWPLFDIRYILLDETKTSIFLSFDLLILDGKSLDLLSQEWCALYHAPDIILPEINSSFFNYIKEYEILKGEIQYKKDLAYWKEKIPYMSPQPHLPLSQKIKTKTSHSFHRYEAQLDTTYWRTLQETIKENRLNSTALIVTVYAEVLKIWSNTDNMTLNLSILDRLAKSKKYENTLGQFASTLLLELNINKEYTFKEQVEQVQTILYTDLKHRSVSGVDVIRELSKVSDTGNVSMPIVFTRHHSSGTVGKGSNHMSWLGNSNYAITQTPQVSIDYQLYEYDDEFTIVWDVAKDIFPKHMIQDMFNAHFKLLNLLATEVETWNKTSQELTELLLPKVHTKLYQTMNDTDAAHTAKLLHDDFLLHSQKRPKQNAVICDDRTLTYAELERESAIVAHWLQKKGVYTNNLVAIVMEKGWEQIVSVLAVLRAGAAYLPLDPNLPKERLNQLLTEGNIQCILSTPDVDQSMSWLHKSEVYNINNSCAKNADYLPYVKLYVETNPSDLAYVIYTSGSTGSPKGVMISHENAVNTIDDITQRFNIGQQDKLLSLSSLSFDLSVFDVFGMLSSGGTIVIPTLHNSKDPSHWLEIIKKYNITLWNSVPPLMQLLYEYTSQKNATLAPLRLIFLSGDWIPLELPEQVQKLTTNAEVISLGGATEASIWSIFYPIKKVDTSWKSIPYGTPLRNQHIYVYNNDLELCPIWVSGEIYIGGKGVGFGYWKNESLTENSFITHPNTGEYLYRTGDMGRLLPEGIIEFLGRKDNQFKIRGFRVEAGEVEATLEKLSGVKKSIVIPEESGREKNHLNAYILAEYGHVLIQDEIKQFIKTKLPDYMQPSHYHIVDYFPLTTNGKIDRQALLQQKNNTTEVLPTDFQNSLDNDTLERVISCVVDILQIQNFTESDNFFNLGATSVDVIRLINRLDQEFDLRLTADHIYSANNFINLVFPLHQYHRHLHLSR